MPSRRTDPTDAQGSDQRGAERSGERIAKLLARAGIASRREIERMIAEGRITRDGAPVDTPATVLASLNGIAVDGKPVAAASPARLFAYHKPAGLLVTERDPRGRPTIYDRLPAALPRVVPVGRLDLATEGLLLLTTDGELKRQLELPATGVERTYRARAYGPVSQGQLEELIDGIEIDGVRYGSIDANLERRTGANTWLELTLTEGKNREVRRVLEHLGLQVGRLIRTRYGPFVLGDMPPGAVGEVRQHDLVAFRQSLKGSKGGDRDMRVMATPLPDAPVEPSAVATARSAARPQPPQVRPVETPATDGRTGEVRGSHQPRRPSNEAPARPAAGGSGKDQDRGRPRQGRPEKGGAAATKPSRSRHGDGGEPGNAAGAVRGPRRPRPSPDAASLRAGSGRVDKRGDGLKEPSARAKPADKRPRAPTARETIPDQPPRPARTPRKPGWARPKPRPAPRGKR